MGCVGPVDLAAVGAITQVADVFLLNGGEIAVQSARMRFGDFEADLVIMDRLGQPRLQLARSPRLLFWALLDCAESGKAGLEWRESRMRRAGLRNLPGG